MKKSIYIAKHYTQLLVPYFIKKFKKVHDKEIIQPITIDSTSEKLPSLHPEVLSICFVEKLNKAMVILNHIFMGGSNLLEIGQIVGGSVSHTNMQSSRKYLGLLCLARLFFDNRAMLTIPTYDRLPISPTIRRFSTYHIMEKGENNRCQIIYRTLQKVWSCLDLDRDLVCYLPVAFMDEYKDVFNNIGVIWITYNKNDDYLSFKQRLDTSYYQAVATNTALVNHLVPKHKGSETRYNTDVVFTMVYILATVFLKI